MPANAFCQLAAKAAVTRRIRWHAAGPNRSDDTPDRRPRGRRPHRWVRRRHGGVQRGGQAWRQPIAGRVQDQLGRERARPTTGSATTSPPSRACSARSSTTGWPETAATTGLKAGAAMTGTLGGGAEDTFFGGRVGGNLFGEAGDDVLVGGNGADHLDGGAGSDILMGGRARTRFSATAGTTQSLVVLAATSSSVEPTTTCLPAARRRRQPGRRERLGHGVLCRRRERCDRQPERRRRRRGAARWNRWRTSPGRPATTRSAAPRNRTCSPGWPATTCLRRRRCRYTIRRLRRRYAARRGLNRLTGGRGVDLFVFNEESGDAVINRLRRRPDRPDRVRFHPERARAARGPSKRRCS